MSEIMALSCLSLDDTSLSSGALAHNLQHCDPVQGHGPGCLNGILVHCWLELVADLQLAEVIVLCDLLC